MNGIVTKPIDPNKLKEELFKWIAPKSSLAAALSKSAIPAQSGLSEMEPADILPGIDQKSALARLKGNRALLKKLAGDFVANHCKIFTDLRQALEQGDWASARRAVHTFKGIAGNLSATELFDSAKRLEMLLQQQNVAEAEEEIEKMERAYEIMAQGIRCAHAEEVPRAAVQTGSPFDIAVAGGMISELYDLLQKHSLDARRKWGLLKATLYQEELKESVARFEECMSRLDFKGAMKTLEDFAKRLGVEWK